MVEKNGQAADEYKEEDGNVEQRPDQLVGSSQILGIFDDLANHNAVCKCRVFNKCNNFIRHRRYNTLYNLL